MSQSPFFPEVTKAWAAAKIVDGQIPAEEFLKAAKDFLPLFDRLGKVFYPVKADVGGNVEKLLKAHAAAAADVKKTLHSMVLAEKSTGKAKDKNGVCIALLWFKRAMQFIFTMLDKVSKGMDANKASKEAYAETLSKYHGFMVKKTFDMGLMAAPSTETMVPCLGTDKASVMKEMTEWVETARPLLMNIDQFLSKEGLDDQSKV